MHAIFHIFNYNNYAGLYYYIQELGKMGKQVG